MSLEAIQHVYDEWSRGNWRPKFDFYDDEMEWGWSDDFPGLAGVYHDPGERNRRVYEWLSGWEDWRCEAEDYLVQGDDVVALCLYSGRGKGRGRSGTAGAAALRAPIESPVRSAPMVRTAFHQPLRTRAAAGPM